MRTTLAETLHFEGKLKEAEKLFQEAENMQKEREPDTFYLYSLDGFRFCDLLISQLKYKEVQKRADYTLKKWAIPQRILLHIALDKHSLGRSYLLQALNQMDTTSEVESIFLKTADYLNQAVAGLREAGAQEFIARGLFARAFFYCILNQFPQAWDDLEEAREIAERGEMKLFLVDYHLEAARVVSRQLAVSSQQSSVDGFRVIVDGREVNLNREEMVGRLKMHSEQAAELVQKTGYHRRDPEIELGYAGLFFAQGDHVKAREHLGTAKTVLDKMGIRCWDFEVRRLEQVIG
jgi:tetratricopeptide (TPR) repeat protein